jgi:hypothetical protein
VTVNMGLPMVMSVAVAVAVRIGKSHEKDVII